MARNDDDSVFYPKRENGQERYILVQRRTDPEVHLGGKERAKERRNSSLDRRKETELLPTSFSTPFLKLQPAF